MSIIGRRPFSPVQLPGCIIWIDATQVSALYTDLAGTTPVAADGDLVGRVKFGGRYGIPNDSVSAYDFTRPTWRKSGHNGKPAFELNGRTVGYQGWTTPVTLTGMSWAVACVPDSTQVAAARLWNDSTNANSGAYFSSGAIQTFYRYPTVGEHGGSAGLGGFHVYSGRYDGNNSPHKMWIDDVEAASGTNSGSVSSISYNLDIGYLSGFFGFGFEGKILEVAVFDRALTDEKMHGLNKYLDEKWGSL